MNTPSLPEKTTSALRCHVTDFSWHFVPLMLHTIYLLQSRHSITSGNGTLLPFPVAEIRTILRLDWLHEQT